jgi:hypothetical protein
MPTPGWRIGCLGVGHPQGVFGIFSYYELVTLFFNMVCLTMSLAFSSAIVFCCKLASLGERVAGTNTESKSRSFILQI